ncbi:MAG TPA: hypothetical protein VF469_05020 [Kofleriaceae bacterium]
MKTPALGACVVAVFALYSAACGGGGKPQLLDSSVDALFACDPVKQTGCKTGEKCTWIVDIDGSATMDEFGHVGCAAVGAAPTQDGAACMEASVKNNMPVDTCAAGDLCISSKCKPICDPQLVDGTAKGACATNYACSVYSGVFTSGTNAAAAAAGVCEPTCDPLTQKLNVGTTGVDACGSADPTNPTATCVVSGGFRSFHCAPFNGDFVQPGTTQKWIERTDRQPPLADSRGNYFGNGCAPGFIPFYVEDLAAGSMTTLCSGMCAPLKVDNVIATGTHATDNQGDATALAKLPTDAAPAAGNAVCTPGKKGATDVTSSFGEDCRFVWFPLANGDPTMAAQTPFNDTLGICFAYEKFLTVTMPGMTKKFPEKSCADLPPTAPTTDPYGSAKANGCYPLAESRRGTRNAPRSALSQFRLANGPAPAVRHIFD